MQKIITIQIISTFVIFQVSTIKRGQRGCLGENSLSIDKMCLYATEERNRSLWETHLTQWEAQEERRFVLQSRENKHEEAGLEKHVYMCWWSLLRNCLHSQKNYSVCFKSQGTGSGQMVQWIRTLTAFPEDPSSVLSTQVGKPESLAVPNPGDLFDASGLHEPMLL